MTVTNHFQPFQEQPLFFFRPRNTFINQNKNKKYS
jgi:hypothetical protein